MADALIHERLWTALEAMADHPVPPMTDPLGRQWRQPPREAIAIDATHAVMTEQTFAALSEYSTTMPTGVYPGKMWRAHPGHYDAAGRWVQGPKWFLRWYGIVPGRDDVCSNNQREVLLC